MKKYYLLTIVTPEGLYYNAVSSKPIGETMISMVAMGICLLNSEQVSKSQFLNA